MKALLVSVSLLLFAAGAWAGKSCEELKARIEAKLAGKGVKHYTLEIVPKDQATDLRVVGTCDGGTKKIIYHRGQKPA